MSETDQPRTTFEILAGKGIGPFRLGMTRARAREIAERGLGAEVIAEGSADAIGDTGIAIHYDETGRCQRVAAWFGPEPSRYAFTLFGEDIGRAADESVTRLFKAHWLYVNCEHWGISVPSAGFCAIYADEYEEGHGDGKLQSAIVENRDVKALLSNLAWSFASAILYVFGAALAAGTLLAIASAAQEVRSIGSVASGFTASVFLLFFLFEWRRIGKWLAQGDFFAAIASVAVNLMLAFFTGNAIASAARQLRVPESQLNAIAVAWPALILAWLLYIVWKVAREIYSRASWGR
jgi:hypothetical protein